MATKENVRKIPAHLLTTPSPLINNFIDFSNRSAIEYIPQFSVQAALVLFSHLYGRQYIGETGLTTGLYGMVVGKSGIGKNYLKHCMQSFDLLNTNVMSGATSSAGLFTALYRNPNLLIISDEIGDKFNSSEVNNKSYWSLVKDVFNTNRVSDQGYSGREAGGKISGKDESYNIKYPSLSLFGLTTPEQLSFGLSETDVKGGVLNRFTLVDANTDEIVINDVEIVLEPTKELLSAILTNGSSLEKMQDAFANKSSLKIPDFKKIVMEKSDMSMLTKRRRELVCEKNSEFTVRVVEKAMKISMIIAISMGLTKIPSSVIKWALEYETYWAYNIKKISESVGGNDYSREVKKVNGYLVGRNEQGTEGWRLRKYCREVIGWRKNIIDSYISEMLDDNFIERDQGIKGANGKTKTLYYYIGSKRK